ncbi:MAG: hypothetical protein ABH891_06885 [Candidatus Omnitrophota bacterium]
MKAMKSAGLKIFFLCLLLGGIFFVPQVFALEEQTGIERSKSDLGDIKARLATLEKQQAEIIAKEDEILKELDRIRIWVHRK